MFWIRVQDEFCAAHMLHFSDGSTEPLHGHNYRVEVVVACPDLDAQGIGIDYTVVYDVLHRLLDSELDHVNLNHKPELCRPNPTSENVARWIAERMADEIANVSTRNWVKKVTVWETRAFGVTYEMPEPPSARDT